MKKVWKIILGSVSILTLIFIVGILFPDLNYYELGRIYGSEILPAVIGLYFGYYLVKKYRDKKKKKELENGKKK